MNERQIEIYLKTFTDKLIGRGYAESTIRQYRSIVVHYLSRPGDATRKTSDEIQQYINKYSGNSATQGQIRGTLQNLYRWVFKQHRKFDYIPHVKKEYKQPVWLTIMEVQNILDNIKNIKQRALIQLAYSCALRPSEAVSVKVCQIVKDGDSGFIHIRASKGKKDRQIPIHPETMNLLRSYFIKYRPNEYLFEGQKGGPYTKTSMRAILRRAAKKAGVNKKITAHTLRHSMATHWLNNGLSTRHVQELLGHKNIKTTEAYTHIAQDEIKALII
jgi:integrase/recombinase XerD